jgi:putative membrane protein insertion efficiency factor
MCQSCHRASSMHQFGLQHRQEARNPVHSVGANRIPLPHRQFSLYVRFQSDDSSPKGQDNSSLPGVPEKPWEDNEDATNAPEEVVSEAMVSAIGFYKTFISPLLPPACRFVPTCSQYGVQAIQEFGPSKGAILTAWRILRCSPIGGKGYDPPRWPPVFYTYSSY